MHGRYRSAIGMDRHRSVTVRRVLTFPCAEPPFAVQEHFAFLFFELVFASIAIFMIELKKGPSIPRSDHLPFATGGDRS